MKSDKKLKKIKKQDLILDAIIKAYLEENSPIGSNELQAKMALNISASTIRSYFQRLSNDGILMQLHISGGRIPTQKALREYWLEKLEVNTTLELKNLDIVQKNVRDFGLFCVLEFNDKENLKEIINVGNRYILLIFNDTEVSINYSNEAFRFLESLIGLSVYDIRRLSHKVSFNELSLKLDRMMVGNILFKEGEEIIYEMIRDSHNQLLYSFYKNDSSLLELEDGIYFDSIVDNGYMAVKQKAKVDDMDAKLLCLGRIDVDFERFFKLVKE